MLLTSRELLSDYTILGLSKTLLGTIENHTQYRTRYIYLYANIFFYSFLQGLVYMNDRKAEIDKIIKDMVKNKSLPYANAVKKIKKDRKGYYQQKDIKLKSKSLSTDRFQQYLKAIQEEDNDSN